MHAGAAFLFCLFAFHILFLIIICSNIRRPLFYFLLLFFSSIINKQSPYFYVSLSARNYVGGTFLPNINSSKVEKRGSSFVLASRKHPVEPKTLLNIEFNVHNKNSVAIMTNETPLCSIIDHPMQCKRVLLLADLEENQCSLIILVFLQFHLNSSAGICKFYRIV